MKIPKYWLSDLKPGDTFYYEKTLYVLLDKSHCGFLISKAYQGYVLVFKVKENTIGFFGSGDVKITKAEVTVNC